MAHKDKSKTARPKVFLTEGSLLVVPDRERPHKEIADSKPSIDSMVKQD
jgi:hypothetical protein